MNNKASIESAVVAAVAQFEGVEPAAIQRPLFEAVDTDALDRLFRDTTGHVRFEYNGYTVTVSSEGDVALEPLAG